MRASLAERTQRSAPRPAAGWRVQTVQNDPPANSCILRHHRTFALLRRKVQSNGRFRGCAVRGLQLVLQPI